MAFHTETLVEVWRGGRLESEHCGAIAVVDATGKLIAHAGDVDLISYLRSSAKPFQLLPLVESGAADRLGFTDAELAVIAGSHAGEPRHVAAVQSILNKIDLPDTALQCGIHVPFNAEAAKALRSANREPSVLHNNCSGKHSGMLAQAVDRGLSTHDYLDPQHPVQESIRRRLAELGGVTLDEIGVGVDGCSAPCFAMPLRAAALAFARLADAGSKMQHAGLGRIARVMMNYPEMVSGEGRLDTDLMRAVPQRVVSKGGAEGYHGLGVIRPNGSALGIAIKIADGDGKRGGQPVVIETLRQLGVLNDEALAKLKSYHTWKITNHRGLAVGEVKANFQMMRDA
ncbi:MAG TPA: asparaginase [Anaerolineae bacterium]|nr:asparaginase [Anaerolineae bacterium]